MIVAETAGGYQFVTQPHHGELAGQFADRWGNDRFARPAPFDATVMAAYTHDVGWWRYDARPHLDTDGAPLDFRQMPAETWIAIYESGIETVAETDAYAGLLVSLHGAGLQNQRYGLSPDWPETAPAFADFVDREADRQRRLVDDVRAAGRYLSTDDDEQLAALYGPGNPPGGAGGRLWADYRRLQAWDTLSLAFCVTDSPPGYREIENVPTAMDRPDATLSIEPIDDGAFAVDPYPFDASPLTVSVPTRTVRRDAFDDESTLVDAYYRADRETTTFTLRRPDP